MGRYTGGDYDYGAYPQARTFSLGVNLTSVSYTHLDVYKRQVYRFGAFHALSQIALLDKIPQSLSKGQIRSALTAVCLLYTSRCV